MGTVEAVERAVAPVLGSLGFELLDVETLPGVLRVTVDREAGLDLAALSKAAAAVSLALDEADPVPGGRYELEVSSPGVERRLRRPEHFAKVIGSPVAVKLRSGAADPDAARRFEGTLVEADAKSFLVETPGLDGVPAEQHRVAYKDVDRCHTVFDWRAALAADSASRDRASKRSNRPTAAERSRAAAAARGQRSSAGHRVPSESTTTPRTYDDATTEKP